MSKEILVMKYLGVLLIIFLGVAVKAQTPDYFDNDPEWRVIRGLSPNVTFDECPTTESIVYYLNGDSIIGTMSYNKLFKRGLVQEYVIGEPDPWDPMDCYNSYTINEFIGLIRQENKQVYIKFIEDEPEQLYCDFNLSVGDSIHSISMITEYDYYEVNPLFTVLEIDSVLINNEYYKRFYYEGEWGFPENYFLEGVGHTYGFIEPPYQQIDFYSNLFCYAQNDSVVYTFEEGEEFCDFSVSINEIAKSRIGFELFPNPAIDQLQIKIINSLQLKSISIYSLSGQKILTQNPSTSSGRHTIDLSQLQSGMYLLEVISVEGFREVKRFVVE